MHCIVNFVIAIVLVILFSFVNNSFQFSIGWWIIIDAAVMYPSETEMHHAVHVCGVIGTLALFMYVFPFGKN